MTMEPYCRMMGDWMLDLNSNNFLSWKARVDKISDALDFPSDHRKEPEASATHLRAWIACSLAACAIIGTLATPKVLEQIDKDSKTQHLKLLSELERLTFRFRFMDLPPEVRNTVYCYLIPQNCKILIAPLSRSRIPTRRRPSNYIYPAITSVSRQIRSESLPLLYSRCRFVLYFMAKADLSSSQRAKIEKDVKIGEHSRSWATCLSTDYLKHLRKVLLFIRVKGRDGRSRISIEFHPNEGLQIEDRDDLKGKSRKALTDYGAEVEETRKMLGLQGEAIIMAITGRDEM